MANYEDYSSWKVKTNDNVEFVCNEKLVNMSNYVYRSIARIYREEARKQQEELASSQSSTTQGDTNGAEPTAPKRKTPVYDPIVLTDVDSNTFRKVLEYVQHYKNKSFHERQLEQMERDKAIDRNQVYVPKLNEWEKRFFQGLDEGDQFMSMVAAANQLEIADLVQMLTEMPMAEELLRKVGDYMLDMDEHGNLVPLGPDWDKDHESREMDTDEAEE